MPSYYDIMPSYYDIISQYRTIITYQDIISWYFIMMPYHDIVSWYHIIPWHHFVVTYFNHPIPSWAFGTVLPPHSLQSLQLDPFIRKRSPRWHPYLARSYLHVTFYTWLLYMIYLLSIHFYIFSLMKIIHVWYVLMMLWGPKTLIHTDRWRGV